MTKEQFDRAVAQLATTGETLYTLKQRKPFQIIRQGDKYYWLPLTTKLHRPITEKAALRVLERFRQTGSTSPVDYQLVTFNSSYYCAVLERIR